MRWAEQVACMRERCTQGFGGGNQRERGHLEGPGVDGDDVKMELQEVEWGMD